MAYSDPSPPRWDRIIGFAVSLVAGFILLEPMVGLLVESCFWEAGCQSPQAPRFVGAFFAAFGLGALCGWTATALLKRLLHRPAG